MINFHPQGSNNLVSIKNNPFGIFSSQFNRVWMSSEIGFLSQN